MSCGSGTSNGNDAADEVVYTGEPLPPVVETDTAKHIADTAKPVWRRPDVDSLLDIVAGDIEVIDLNDTMIEEGETEVYGIAEVSPEFPGGMEALLKYIADNLKYPQLALENSIQGKVDIALCVEEDGSVSNVRVLRDIGGGCGKEAMRLVESMPKWTPGRQGGKVVCTQFNLPINFVLPEDRPRLVEGMAPVEYGTRMPADSAQHETIGPNAPMQQMEVEGVKLIVK